MDKKRPLVTLVVAVFNGAGTVQRCIDSFAKQTYPSKELLIMDGGSTDATVDILKANQDRITYWESKPDRGIYHAWNKALERSKGEWICFLGADDYFATDSSLEHLVSAAVSGACDVVCARGEYIDTEGSERRIWGEPWRWDTMKKEQRICHPGALYHRRLFEKFGHFSEKYKTAGDYEFNLRLGADIRACFLDEVTVCLSGGGVSRAKWVSAILERTLLQSRHKEIGPVRASWNGIDTLVKVAMLRILESLGYKRG